MHFNEAIFIDNIGKIIVFLMLLFSIFLLTVKSKKRLPNFLFAAFLLVTAFDLSGLFLGSAIAQFETLQHIKTASSLLQMPLFFLYVLAVCYADFKLHWKQLLHSLPFVIFLGIFSFNIFPNYPYDLYEVAGEVQYFTYIIAIFLVLKRHKTIYLENFSNPDYSAYKWLFQATVLFCIAHTFVLIRMYLEYMNITHPAASLINVVISISALSVTCWMVMKSMYEPSIFLGTTRELQPLQSSKTKLDLPVKNERIQQLRAFMDSEKPYLDYELSLEKLAQQVQMEEKELSLLINHQIGKHFFDFINEYRIAAAKAILKNPAKKKLTVLEILYEVGFNSKSSFYTAFKKETGQTPVSYRKSNS
ncbi:MAG: helix-turn-helix domain-containing protein [Saprospiraceae bacterium]